MPLRFDIGLRQTAAVLGAVAGLAVVAAPLGAQVRLTPAAAPTALTLHKSAMRDSLVSMQLPDSVADSTMDDETGDVLGPGSGIVAVDRLGHTLSEIPAALRRREDEPDYAKTGSSARLRAPAAITPPPSTALTSL